MTPADMEFAWTHAFDWACPDVDWQRAHDYADWYSGQFVIGARDMGDLPAHPDVWGAFLDRGIGGSELAPRFGSDEYLTA